MIKNRGVYGVIFLNSASPCYFRMHNMQGKQPIFLDTANQSLFDSDGYIVVDFISKENAFFLASLFYKLHKEIPEGFYAEAFNPDIEIKNEIFAQSDKVIEPALKRVFTDVKKLGSTFLCKAPGKNSKVGVHQDWTIVDESKYCSATIWIPLTDTDERNGALKVLPGSHVFSTAYRSNNIPYVYRGNETLIWDNMVTVPMKAGQAFILNHAVIHASPINLSPKERLVMAYGIASKDAALTFYHAEKSQSETVVEKFEMPDDFFQRYYNVGQRPKFGRLTEEFNYRVDPISPEKMKYLIETELHKRNLKTSWDTPEN